MTVPLWKKLEWSDRSARLDPTDQCFYARTRLSHGGFGASTANQDISNLKISPTKKGTSRWRYKTAAIRKFANELRQLFAVNRQFAVAAMPTSKRRDDPEFDSRLDQVVCQLAASCDNVTIVDPVIRVESIQAAHASGDHRPSIEDHVRTLEWNSYQHPSRLIVVVDDVITAGTTFKAVQRIIRQRRPDLDVWGVFWAKTVWNADELE